MRLSIVPLLGLTAILAGCATVRSDYETPSVTVASFALAPGTSALPEFLIGLHVINPNREALKLYGIAYTISLEGHELLKGVSNDLPEVEGYGEADFTLTATVNVFQGIRLIGDMMNSPRETLNYELTAKLDIGPMQPAIRIAKSGEISTQAGVGSNRNR